MKIAPSILAADLLDLGGAVGAAEAGGADLLHVDVMDGHFVPNLSFGIPVVAALARRSSLPLDVHLMVANPERLLDEYVGAGAACISIHWEAAPHVHRLVVHLRSRGVRAGVALNPATPMAVLEDVLPDLDFVLVMSVDPGWGGQSFIPAALGKAAKLRDAIARRGLSVEIEMDGGIGPANIAAVANSGVTIAVAGSEVYRQPDPAAAIRALRSRVETASPPSRTPMGPA
ncbi:MAG TPA: ribulose-phosphate 3-epimerase [Thermoanaerobaculia bacterium]|nr:ribulose-phosphate 3-epimerase [Thermoanaerobaculia bacterium]